MVAVAYAFALLLAPLLLLAPPQAGGEYDLLLCVIAVLRRWRERAGAVGGGGWSLEESPSPSSVLPAGVVEGDVARF